MGPISHDAFDQYKGIPGAAAKLGFVGGYEADYSSHTAGVNDEGGSSLEIQLLRFSSPEYAKSYEMTVSADPGKFAKSSAFPAILGAIVIAGDPTGFRDASCCEHEVLATKGPVVMLVHYFAAGAGAGGMPSILGAWAEQQYARL